MYGPPKTPVMFRKFNDGAIGALFLEEKDNFTQPINIYIRRGYAKMDYAMAIMTTKPCIDQDYIPILRELEQMNYRIRVVTKRQKR